MTARDVNIAYLKRLKTSYELRAKELELQAALYRQDAFNPFPLPHSRHFHGRGPPAVRMTSGFEDDDCPCTADIGYNTMCSFRDEGRSTVKIVQPDPRDATNESSTSLDLDLATLSVIRQLATREKETKKRIARLDTVEAAIMSLIKENPPPPKNDQQETAECKGKLKLDSEIQLDVARMKEVADHLALKVKETVNTVQKEFSAHEAANLVTCQPACPDAELASNLQESVQCVSEEMSDITSTDKIIPELGNEAETTAEDAPVEETGCAEKTAEPATADEPDKGNDKMEIMKRNVSIVVDHLKVCDECPVKEFENINQDLESILEIFQNIHDETSHPKQSEALDARYTTYNVAAERREDAVTEQDESAMETIDDIIARATKVVCETIIKETEVSLKTMRRSLDEEHPLINVENVPPTSDIGTNLAEHGNEIQQPSASLNKEHTSPNVEDIPPKTKMDTESAESENVTQQESPVESSNAQHKLFNCCSACLCLTENTEAAQPMLLAEHGMDKLPEEVPQAEVTLVEPEPAFDDAAEEVTPAESTADDPEPAFDDAAEEVPPAESTGADPEPAFDDAAEEVPPAEVTLVEPEPAFDDAAEEVTPAESTADDPEPAFDDAAEEVPPAEVTLVEPEPAFDDAAEEVPPAESTADDLEPALDDAAEEVPPAEVTLVEPGPAFDDAAEEVPPAEVTLVEPEPAFDDAAEEVPPAESTADDLEPALDDAAEEVPPAEVTLVEPGPAFDDAAEEVPPAESTADDPGPAFDDAAEEVPPAEVTLVEPEPAFDDAAEEVPPAEGTPTQPVRKVLAKVLAKRVGESVGCQTAITFTGRCKVKVTTICVSSVAACATVAKDKEAEGTPMEPDPAVDDAPEEVPPAEGTPTQPVPMVGESVGCQTAITFTGRCKVNVTTIRVSAVAACATVAKDVDERENTCKCKSQEREEITVLTEDDEEKPFAITESVESVTETSVSKSVEDMAENESTADASPIKSAVEVPLAEIAAEPPPAEVAVEQIPQEPSAEESKELAAVEPSPDLAPVESLKDAAVLESASKHSLEEPVTLPAPIETVVEQVPDVQEVAEELSSKPSDTAASPADVQSPSKVVSSKSVVRSPDPTRSPGKIPSSEKPRKPSDPAKSPAKTASTPIAVNTSKEKSPVRGVSSTIAAETSKEKSPVKGVSSPIVVKTPKEKSPVRGVSSTIAAKTSREKSPVKGVSSPIVVKTPKEKSPVKGVSSPIVVKTPSEKSPVKCVSSPIAVKTSREKSSVKGVSSPIVVKTPREKIPVKGVSSPIVVKTQREKSPVKSTTSPIAIKPNKDNIPRKSGSTSSAEKPADQKTSAAKHPSTPSTKVHRRSIGSVGSRSSAKSASSKKSDVQQKRGCACNRRQESSCKKRGANNGFAPGMCPSSPQRKCFCRKPSSRRESPSKGRGAKGVNVDAPAEAPLITVNRKCFCAQWAIYRENHFKCRGPKDEKDQQKPPVAKNCKCTHKKLK